MFHARGYEMMLNKNAVVLLAALLAMVLTSCSSESGGKDASDYCDDFCVELIECDTCHAPDNIDRFDAIEDDMDLCVDYNHLAPGSNNEGAFESVCLLICREVAGEEKAVSSKCEDALSDFWKCNSELTCDEKELIVDTENPAVAQKGGLYLPDFDGACTEEITDALEACEGEIAE
ncbi:MAG: hypothetical protein ACI8W3_002693 [Myxococcota bacterium]|jgi:hypothetical protein